jgi:hypothetical protein
VLGDAQGECLAFNFVPFVRSGVDAISGAGHSRKILGECLGD